MSDHEKTVAALRHLNEQRAARPGVPLVKLVDEAARQLDLDALQSEWLLRVALQPRECSTCGGALQEAKGLEGQLVCGSGHLVTARPPD
jgi:hypothetical protein